MGELYTKTISFGSKSLYFISEDDIAAEESFNIFYVSFNIFNNFMSLD